MKTILVVTQPFADYARGDEISKPDAIAAALETNESHVVRRAVEDPPAPAKAPKTA